jgi:hypothetical protein
MPDRSNDRDQTKCRPWSSKLGVRHGVIKPVPEKSTVTKYPEPVEEDHGGGGLWRPQRRRASELTKIIMELLLLPITENCFTQNTLFFLTTQNFAWSVVVVYKS